MMAVMPGGFDQHATEMRIARFGDAAAGACRAAGVFGGDEAGKGQGPRGRGKGAGVPEFGGDGQRGEVIDAPKASETLDARPERFDREQIAQLGTDGLEACGALVDGPA